MIKQNTVQIQKELIKSTLELKIRVQNLNNELVELRKIAKQIGVRRFKITKEKDEIMIKLFNQLEEMGK